MWSRCLTALVLLLLAMPVPAQSQTVSADRVRLNTGPCVTRSGSGSPEAVVTGNICDIYVRSDTGAVYAKTSGTGTNTGWVALASSAGYVPYTGATANVDLGAWTLTAAKLWASSGTEAQVELVKTGADANTSYFYNAGTVFGLWDYTNARAIWTHTISTQANSFSGPTLAIGGTNAAWGNIQHNTAALGTNPFFATFVADGVYNPRLLWSHVTSASAQSMVFDSTFTTGSGYANWNFAHGNVGIGTTSPVMKTQIEYASTLPAETGNTPTGHLRFSYPSGGTIVADMGLNASYPFGLWIQATRSTGFEMHDPIVLQPNGGNVGVGVVAPSATFAVGTGTTSRLTVDGATGSLVVTGLSTFTGGATVVSGQSLATAYSGGWAGAGYTLNYNSSFASQSFLEVDRLNVRGTMSVYELLVHQIRATNGSIYVANTGKAKVVTDNGGGSYTIETETAHGFAANDLIRAQRFTGTGTYQSDMTVASVADTTHFTAALRATYAEPVAGMEYVRLGSTSDAARRGSIYLTADDTGAPFISVQNGVAAFTDWGTTAKTKTVVGNLTSVTGTTEYGILAGTYASTGSGKYIIFSDQTAEIHNVPLSLYDGSNQTLYLSPTNSSFGQSTSSASSLTYSTGVGCWSGIDSGAFKWRCGDPSGQYINWNGSTLVVNGDITVTGLVADDTVHVDGVAAATVASGASRGALGLDANGNPVLPHTATPSGSGLFLGSDYMGYYASSAWQTYITSGGDLFLGGASGPFTWDASESKGIISGWTFASSAMTKTASGNTIGLDTGGTNIFYAGPTGAPTFTVTPAGAMTSTSGTIGGFTIGSAYLYAGSGATRVQMTAAGGFHAGATAFADAPFSVSVAGALKTTSGTVGGWTLGATSLTAGTGATTVGVDSGGTNPAFYAGSATPASAPFRVTQAGALTATSAAITGTVNATAGYFGSGSTKVAINSDGLDVGTAGRILGGMTAYNTGTGFFLGYSGGAYKFAVGHDDGNRITWDGTDLTVVSAYTTIDAAGIRIPVQSTSAIEKKYLYGFTGTYAGMSFYAGGNDLILATDMGGCSNQCGAVIASFVSSAGASVAGISFSYDAAMNPGEGGTTLINGDFHSQLGTTSSPWQAIYLNPASGGDRMLTWDSTTKAIKYGTIPTSFPGGGKTDTCSATLNGLTVVDGLVTAWICGAPTAPTVSALAGRVLSLEQRISDLEAALAARR